MAGNKQMALADQEKKHWAIRQSNILSITFNGKEVFCNKF
jgi:hypothetical protein